MNQKLKIFVIMLIVCFCGISQLYSQEQTAYHKQLIEIKRAFTKEVLIALLGSENWTEKSETSQKNYNEKDLDEMFQDCKEALMNPNIQRETAVKIINKLVEDVSSAKKLKSTDATKKEFDDARERKINRDVEDFKGVKKMIIEMEVD
jgi:signal recognition particle GTPase